MTPKEAIQFFKTRDKLAKLLDIDPVTIWYWLKNGVIPFRAQKKIHGLSKGKLTVSEALITLDQIEQLGAESHKIIQVNRRTLVRWKKQQYIPYLSQKRIYPLIKKQEKKNANAFLREKRKK